MGVPSYAGLHKPTVLLLLTLLSARPAPRTTLPPFVTSLPVRRAAAAPPLPIDVPRSHLWNSPARSAARGGRAELRLRHARESQGRASRPPSPNLLCRATVRIDQMGSHPGWWILSSDGEEEGGEEELWDPRGGRRMANGR
jgi:hypothetical protein